LIAVEDQPAIKAQYEKSAEAIAKRIDAREGKHTLTQGRIDSAIAFLKRVSDKGLL
jgi:hypothetical protein